MIFSKKKKVFLKTGALIFIFSAFCFLCVQKIKAEDEGLIITEIMFDPINGGQKGDWFEIYNNSDKKIIVEKKNLKIVENSGVCHKSNDDLEIDPNEYVVVVSDKKQFEENFCKGKEKCKYEGKIVDSSFSLKKDGEIKISFEGCKNWETEILYESTENSEKGYSIEWDEKGNRWKKSWILGGTPGEKKSEPKKYFSEIEINEIFPNPEKGKTEYIELYNFSKKNEDLSGWILKDESKTGKYVFPNDSIIKAGDYFVVYKKEKEDDEKFFKFSLNNSGNESVYLFNPNGKEVSKMKYLGSNKNISWNFDGKKWRQSKFLTPGEENKFNNLPEVKLKIDEDVYKNIYADFEVEAKDKDKDKLKIAWDFGDGHKSYLEKTRHKYEKEGNYFVSVKVFDGSEDIVRSFAINVEKYPRREVKIVEIMPNPSGLDSENEYITVKNDSKKTVNLKGWSVASGASKDKLVNHPIYNSIKIKSGGERRITRKDSYFSLGNKEAYIELRYPDGKVAYSLKYKEKESIKNNSILQKEKGKKWEWIVDEIEDDKNSVNSKNTQTTESSGSVSIIPIAENDGQKMTNDEDSSSVYAGKITQKPIEIEISPEMHRKLSKAVEDFNIDKIQNFSIRQENGKYFFTAKTAFSEHYAKKFLEQLLQKINTFLNSLFI
ncbi:MAG: Surface layer protein B [Candidatus Moranbacteria bacterium GW2011_GWE2_35_2-]|nr:MAG: Surface layer protein B [Candidatus Moranbacteria bacterium GW2011_GWE2_35_2-]KKQ05426.1 MAG: Surface layer protein B [Candidatus Moranbacteria bacterium GW2011_GWF1_36_4]KKQ22631.1 MAG: Surface layer protein B [Candidatus Moranbacteria bacterium GW2011_GWF2_37_11]KKQ29034.1 MAG: Surface layer protein B [Candidatus Moranbacteria bacterium GW2011_GWD1_37_17]KKQ30430.1 MAG: Surface layer protein B [Candidatus Moranbacteria bacterium GW2011_GWE1_37_24]KKQ47910.1 MAG: Surface layer protein